jgi:hypothetical protein
MTTMDVFLTQAAFNHLLALARYSPYPEGLLIGHKRGGRFLVESVISIPMRVSSVQSKFIQINQEFGGRVLGFFTSRPSKIKREKLFRPLFMSKVILELKVSPKRESSKKEPGIKTYVVDYDGKFFLTPLKIKKDT